MKEDTTMDARLLAIEQDCLCTESLAEEPDETIRIITEMLPAFRSYAMQINMNDRDYEALIWSARGVLYDLQRDLDVPELEQHSAILPKGFVKNEDPKKDRFGKPKKLWHIYAEEVFFEGSKRWAWCDKPGYQLYNSPVSEPEFIDSITAAYLAKPYMYHPYIDWALINAYLLDTGRRYIEKTFERYGAEFVNDKLDWLPYAGDYRTRTDDFRNIGPCLWHMAQNPSEFENVVKKWMSWKSYLLSPYLPLWLIISTVLFYWGEPIWGGLVIGLGILDLRSSYKSAQKKIDKASIELKKLKNEFHTLKTAWGTANSPAINPIEIRERVKRVEELNITYPATFHALIGSVINRHGSTLSVAEWV